MKKLHQRDFEIQELLSIDSFARAAEAVEVLRWSVEAATSKNDSMV